MYQVRGVAPALTAAIVIVLGLAPTGGLLAQESAARIGVAELKKLYDAGTVVVIDVRSAGAYANSHVAHALFVPLDGIEQKAGDLKKTGKTVVAYCT
jgi:hypothetical protein